jgi:hypothetical protein
MRRCAFPIVVLALVCVSVTVTAQGKKAATPPSGTLTLLGDSDLRYYGDLHFAWTFSGLSGQVSNSAVHVTCSQTFSDPLSNPPEYSVYSYAAMPAAVPAGDDVLFVHQPWSGDPEQPSQCTGDLHIWQKRGGVWIDYTVAQIFFTVQPAS